MVARCDLTAALRRRASLAAFLVNLAGALSLGVYMLVVFPVEGEESPFLQQGIGLTAVALFTIVSGLSAYRRAAPWFRSMREWLRTGGAPTPEQCRAVLRMPARYARSRIPRRPTRARSASGAGSC